MHKRRRPSFALLFAAVFAVVAAAGCGFLRLEKRLLSEKPRVRASALKRVRMMPADGRKGLVKPMIDTMAAGEGPLASRAADALIAIGEPAVDGLIEVLNGSDPYIKVMALSLLGDIGARPSALIPEFVAALDDPHPLVREEAAVALGRLGQRAIGAVPALYATLKDPKEEVRQAAAESLRRLGAKNVPVPVPNAAVSPSTPTQAPGRS